ncbi:hypothetical protein KCU85_g239, partial [Aureobasidium melanogenum]
MSLSADASTLGPHVDERVASKALRGVCAEKSCNRKEPACLFGRSCWEPKEQIGHVRWTEHPLIIRRLCCTAFQIFETLLQLLSCGGVSLCDAVLNPPSLSKIRDLGPKVESMSMMSMSNAYSCCMPVVVTALCLDTDKLKRMSTLDRLAQVANSAIISSNQRPIPHKPVGLKGRECGEVTTESLHVRVPSGLHCNQSMHQAWTSSVMAVYVAPKQQAKVEAMRLSLRILRLRAMLLQGLATKLTAGILRPD